jgi:hypothetical protein
MAMVDIQSLFQDIIESPRQRQQAMAEMGQREAQIATNALSGRSQIFAPLVGALARNQGARDEMLQRSVGGLFGLDTRNESEKLQEMLSQADTPEKQAQLPATLRQMGYGQQAMALEQQLAEQQRALEDRERAEELRVASLNSRELGDKLTTLELEATQQQMDIRAAGLEADEEQRALAETARQAALAQREALATWFTGKGNEDLAGLARAGVVTPTNLDSFVVDNKPIVLGKDDILVSTDGNVIVRNPSTNEQVARDYSLTGPEIETYETLIEENDDIKAAFQTPRRFWPGVVTNENKIRILIDEAERIRTQNPELSKEAAMRQALGQGATQAAVPAQGQPLPLVTTQEEWDRIPSGQQYTSPDGQVRTKR